MPSFTGHPLVDVDLATTTAFGRGRSLKVIKQPTTCLFRCGNMLLKGEVK